MRRLRYVGLLAQILSRTAAAVILLALVAPAIAAHVFDDFNEDWPYDATGIVPPGGIWSGGYNFGAGGPHDSNITNPGNLTMGGNGVGWEADNTTGPMQYVTVDASMPFSARVKISSQTNGFWSLSGLIVRAPQALGSGAERYVTNTSFRPNDGSATPPFGTGYAWQMTSPDASGENEVDLGGLAEADLSNLRIDNLGGGTFNMYTSSDGASWILRGSRTNAALAAGPLEVGIENGALGDLPDATTAFDRFELFMVPEPASLGLALVATVMGIAWLRRRRAIDSIPSSRQPTFATGCGNSYGVWPLCLRPDAYFFGSLLIVAVQYISLEDGAGPVFFSVRVLNRASALRQLRSSRLRAALNATCPGVPPCIRGDMRRIIPVVGQFSFWSRRRSAAYFS